jgi:hypothetical protein
MDDQAWVFERPTGERLELGRRTTPDGLLLVVTGQDAPRSYFFRDLQALVAFQRDMEAFLIGTGWRFVSFSPDRRSGRDRRRLPRLTERRRWWTDSKNERGRTPQGRRGPRR